MSRDQRLFMVALGEATPWDAFLTHMETAISATARGQSRRYGALRGMFTAALLEPDDAITLRFRRRPKPDPRVLGSYVLLSMLSGVLILEWGTYTFPAIFEYMRYVMHRCGLP